MLILQAFVWFTEGTGFLVTLHIKIFLISEKLIRGNKVTKDISFGFYQVFKNNTELASIFHKGNERVFGPAELLFWDKFWCRRHESGFQKIDYSAGNWNLTRMFEKMYSQHLFVQKPMENLRQRNK